MRIFSVFSILMIVVSAIYAQDDSSTNWAEAENGSAYNCDVLSAIMDNTIDDIDEFRLEPFLRIDDEVTIINDYIAERVLNLLNDDTDIDLTLDVIFADPIEICFETSETSDVSDEMFTVVVQGNVNLRSCSSTDCDIVGQAVDGSLLSVVAEEDDWYRVTTDEGPAYIAAWLTQRGPDDVIISDEAYFDSTTDCIVVVSSRRGDMDIQFIINGEDRRQVFVDLYRPTDTEPLRVEGQLDKTFIDTGEPYIQQYYHWGLYWPTGVYEIELSRNGNTTRLAWDNQVQAEYNIYVQCD